MADCLSWLQSSDPIIGGFNLWVANWEREGIVDFSANSDFLRHFWKDAGVDCLTLPRLTMGMFTSHFQGPKARLHNSHGLGLHT